MSELVRAAMRMRLGRIVLGECWGAEVREVLAVLNTEHEDGWATIHTNPAADVPARFAALGALAGMSEDVATAQAASALGAVVHIERRDEVRVLTQVTVLERRRGELAASVALEFDGKAVTRSPAWPRLAARVGMNTRTGAEVCATSDARIGAETDIGVGAGTGTDVGIGSATSIRADAAGEVDGRARTDVRSGVHW